MNVPTQAPPPAKKGMSPLAWVGIGCGVIIVFGVIAMAAMGFLIKRKVDQFKDNPTMTAAELVVRANPDLELISSDPKTSTLTVKNKKTGEVVTFSAEDAKNGKFSVKTDKGTTTLDTSKNGTATVKVTDEKGQEQVSTFGATGAQSLPSWVPQYPGGTMQGSFDTTGPQGRSAAFGVVTKDSVEKVADWYESQLKGSGFKVDKNTFATNGTTSGGQTQAAVTFEDKK